jgi:biopolymer transport protein ExbB
MRGFEVFQQGGPVMWPLLLISILAVAFAVERLIAYYYFGRTAPGLAEEVIGLLKQGKTADAMRRAEETPGPVATSIVSVLRNRNLETPDIKREVAVSTEDYFVRLERFLPALDTFTTLSPLLGLLGTILGMVRVFQQFTGAANEETRADILAGVGESLYATAFGIAIAVFSFAIYNYFSARQRSLSIEADRAANQLIGYVSSQRPDTAKDNAPRRRQPHSLTNVGRTLKKTKIEIIPMIDTMFFLLVFFILSSVGLIKLQGLPVNLPEANSADRQQPAKITISVTPESRVKINNRDVKAGDDIGAILQNEIRIQAGSSDTARAEAQVVINADRDTPSRAVVDILSKAANVGIGRVSVATRKGAVAPGTP